ncbi:MAG: hypothetical protein IJG68_03100 [Bacilli bacterium]|nr:hypothetical protein [Bacilli bacterium]
MKEFLEKINELKEHPNGKAIFFFAFYFVFFAFVFLWIHLAGDKDAITQEYEKGNSSSFNMKEIFSQNYVYDYKVTIDNVLHDYYGKKLSTVESFKYNNQDYYNNEGNFFVHMNDDWVNTSSPYLYSEFYQNEIIKELFNRATYYSTTTYDNGTSDFHFLISSNTFYKLFYDQNTDYDEVPNEIIYTANANHDVVKITYLLDSYCATLDDCGEHLTIELNYDLFGSMESIDNPVSNLTNEGVE